MDISDKNWYNVAMLFIHNKYVLWCTNKGLMVDVIDQTEISPRTAKCQSLREKGEKKFQMQAKIQSQFFQKLPSTSLCDSFMVY